MKLTVLVDNNTLIDRYFLAEPGLSFLIEDNGYALLFDTGYSDIFIRNAGKMGKDLACIDTIVLSHSHLDHTWGLEPFIRMMTERRYEQRPVSKPNLVCHPLSLTGASTQGIREFGNLMARNRLAKHFSLQLHTGPVELTKNLIFLGEIPRKNNFEGAITFGYKDGCEEADTVPEDSALVCRTAQGLVIVTGCSHAGICNIVSYAMEVCHDNRIVDIIGGLHLQQPGRKQIEGTMDFLERVAPIKMHACHCTDLASKIALSRVADIEEVGVGLTLEWEAP